MNETVLVNKPLGKTPLEATQMFKQKFPAYRNEKIGYAGRLDPMADGLLLLLVGEKNKEKDFYENLTKTYEFTILFGITTDTYDRLGLVTNVNPLPKDILTRFEKILPSFLGKRDQPYPPFSSMTVSGKPLYYWARQGKLDDITIPKKTVAISSLNLLSTTSITREGLIAKTLEDISKVVGDFRQDEITKTWLSLAKDNLKFPMATCRATVTTGTYIRSLAHELGGKLDVGGIAYGITRTEIGDYKLSDAVDLLR